MTTSTSPKELFTSWTYKLVKLNLHDAYHEKLCSGNLNNIDFEQEVISIAKEFKVNSSLEVLAHVSHDTLQIAAEILR